MWCDGNLDAFYYYTLARPVTICDLPADSIIYCSKWMEAAKSQFEALIPGGYSMVSSEITGIPQFNYLSNSKFNVSFIINSLSAWIQFLHNRGTFDFNSMAELNEETKRSFIDFELDNLPFSKEIHQLALTTLGAVLIREVTIADLNDAFNWKINGSLKDPIIYQVDLAFPDFLDEGNIAYFLTPYKALKDVFEKHKIPKEKHWEFTRFASKKGIPQA